MKSPLSPTPLLVRGYRLLLRCYPAEHRARFGESMDQLFRDQHREAEAHARAGRKTRLVVRTLLDFLVSCPSAHWQQLRAGRGRASGSWLPRAEVTSGLLVAFVIFGAAVWITHLLPNTYLGVARFQVKWGSNAETAPPPPGPAREWIEALSVPSGPADLATSTRVLSQVADRLGLAQTWSARYLREGTLHRVEVAAILRDQVEVRRFRLTNLIEVRAYNEDPVMASRIANSIVDVLIDLDAQAHQGTRAGIERTDVAEPSFRPVRPNVVLNVLVGGVAAVLLGLLTWMVIALLRAFAASPRVAR